MNQKWWNDLVGTARPQPHHHGSAGVSQTVRDARRSLLFCLYQPCTVSSTSPCSLLSLLILFLNITCLLCVSSQHVCLCQLTSSVSQPESSEAARNCSAPSEGFFVCFSLGSPNKCSSTAQCKAGHQACVVSKESFTMSFYAFALAEHLLSCICFSDFIYLLL